MNNNQYSSDPSFQPRKFDIDYPNYPEGHGSEESNDAHNAEDIAEIKHPEILTESESTAEEELHKRKSEFTDGVELLEVLALPVTDLFIHLVLQISEDEEGKPVGEFQSEWEQLIKVRKILSLDHEPDVPRLLSLVEENIELRTRFNKNRRDCS